MTDERRAGPPPATARVRGIDQSKIRLMFDRAEERGGDLVRLELGEPDFAAPEHAIEAAVDAARGGTGYTSNAGTPSLRAAIAEDAARRHGADVDPASEVIATVGAMEALHLALLSVAEAGDEVLYPAPGFPSYPIQARLADAVPVEVPMAADEGFALDPDRVVEALSAETAAVVLNSPCNPTGRVADPDAVRAVVEAAADHDAYVVADEVYGSLAYDGEFESALSLDADNLLVVDGCSKRFAMTGWRLGWLVGPEAVVGPATKAREGTTSCPVEASQAAAVAALTGPQDPVESMRATFRERRDLVVDRIADVPGVSCPRPEGAFYAFLDVREIGDDSLEVATDLLDERGVVTAPGSGFGAAGEGFLRLSFAAGTADLEEGLDRIEAFVRDRR